MCFGRTSGFRSNPQERAFYASVSAGTIQNRTPSSVRGHAVGRGALLRQLRDRQGIGEMETLREIHSDALELGEHHLGLDTLGDGGDAEGPTDLADGLDHAAVDRILRDVTDELPVDF